MAAFFPPFAFLADFLADPFFFGADFFAEDFFLTADFLVEVFLFEGVFFFPLLIVFLVVETFLAGALFAEPDGVEAPEAAIFLTLVTLLAFETTLFPAFLTALEVFRVAVFFFETDLFVDVVLLAKSKV